MSRFDAVPSKVDFIAIEERLLEWWKAQSIVDRYLKKNEKASKRFSFIDGPITANNPMAVHHAWGRTYKDLFLRFYNMRGYKQRFQNGFDGQGLWVEVEVEKELGFKSKRDIEKFGIDRFVEECKARVSRFSDVMTSQSERLGQWMQWDDSYQTMSAENNYTIWHFLKVCHERGWIYQGTDVMPWCTRCGTGLSQQEIVTEGYQDIVHPGLSVKFPIEGRPGESLLIWTTTPWTLTSNVAAAVNPSLTYIKVRQGDERLYLAKGRLGELDGEFETEAECLGSDLVGLRYRAPFYDLPVQQGVEHRVIAWDQVGSEEGTGIVHIAPGAGAEDFVLGNEQGLAVIAPLDEFGDFKEGFGLLEGVNVFDAQKIIFNELRIKGVFYKVEDYSHRYPICWRCGTELVFRLVDEWYISMSDLRPLMTAMTKKIKWIPGFGLERELDWLRNMRDWMISKKRYWGLALPIYKCACGNVDVLGSEVELKERAVKGWDEFQGKTPHRPWIDAVVITCSKCNAYVHRIPDVGNAWLDAGIVPYSTLGYLNDRKHWKDWFPADWISESFPGQFRNWFYSLLAMSATLRNEEPFKAVFTYGLLNDEHGKAMHKSGPNAILFDEAAKKMGVDVMRWMYARANPAANLNFGYQSGDEVRRHFILPLWNVYSFFVTYANLDGFDPSFAANRQRSDLDRWIQSELQVLIRDVTHNLLEWHPEIAVRKLEDFVEVLTNWYVRRSRRRFWKSENDSDKEEAYQTLYSVLTTLVRILAPFVPFLTEEIYQNLVVRCDAGAPTSVHLCDWPTPTKSQIDDDLSKATRLAMRLSSLGRSARASAKLKVRQPLAELVVDMPNDVEIGYLKVIEDQIKDELNVKSIREAREIGGLVAYAVKPNLPLLGRKYGPKLPEIRAELINADAKSIAILAEAGKKIRLGIFELDADEVLIEQIAPDGYEVVSDGGYTVGISLELTPSLKSEGLAREVVHLIQNLRRDSGLSISDRIVTYIQSSDEIRLALEPHANYVLGETLSTNLVFRCLGNEAAVAWHEIAGTQVGLGIIESKNIS